MYKAPVTAFQMQRYQDLLQKGKVLAMSHQNLSEGCSRSFMRFLIS